uniref:Uncharacterized protein n=1 Tax=Schizaphis graminum TaxID=13262 RepID=A0A2S2PF11_SCHGA
MRSQLSTDTPTVPRAVYTHSRYSACTFIRPQHSHSTVAVFPDQKDRETVARRRRPHTHTHTHTHARTHAHTHTCTQHNYKRAPCVHMFYADAAYHHLFS